MNKENNIKTFLVVVLTCLSVSVFSVVFWYTFFYAPTDQITIPKSLQNLFYKKYQGVSEAQASSQQQGAKEIYPASYPKQLRIPSIDINSKVVYVGITSKGNMATPSNFTDVGWFEYGTLPGGKGSAVIAGHVNDGIGFPAVFANLHNLNLGDSVYVDTIGGGHLHFVVVDIQTYDFDASTEAIFNQNDGKFLKLITCAGIWMDKYKTHNKRLVVTAKQI